jgi:hypothetical protein
MKLWVGAIFLTAASCAHTEGATTKTEPAGGDSAAEQVIVADEPGLKIDVQPGDAELIIDGQSYGRVADIHAPNGVLSLKPGLYQVSLKREGFQTWRAEVTVGEKSELLRVALVKR